MKFRTHFTIFAALLVVLFALPLHTSRSGTRPGAPAVTAAESYVSNAYADALPAPQRDWLAATFAQLSAARGLDPARQASCAADASGALYSLNGDMRIIPASVSKLYLFDFALSKMPTTFRYTTTFVRSNGTLYINGAGDPQMSDDHLRTVLDEISADDPAPITAVVISSHFHFDMTDWKPAIRMAIERLIPGVSVSFVDESYGGDGTRYQFQSVPLSAFLKDTSNHSNNFYADALFGELGGADAMADHLQRTYGVGPETAQFKTGSGLSGNYTTCALTLRVLDHLDRILAAKDLTLTDVMTMPEVDPGVLAKRTIDPDAVESLVAKSGYVNWHHNLAGIINGDRGHVYFATFTDYPPSVQGKDVNAMVDEFTNDILTALHPSLQSLDYTPDPSVFEDYRVTAK